jgi:transposase
MYLKKATNKKTGRTYLSMVRSYYDPKAKSARTKTIQSYGYVDELQADFDDPIAHFEAVVAQHNKEEDLAAAEYVINERKDTRLKQNSWTRKNFGYVVILNLFHELGLDQLLINRQRKKKFNYNTSNIMKLLVTSRILFPGSKKSDFDNRKQFFDFEKDKAFSLDDVYHALSHFATISTPIQLQIHDRITKQYDRRMDLIYYDVTNYYFESDREDELKAKGVSKEHRPDPIVQMGLAMDAEGIPISFDVFAGNESEKLHFRPMIGQLRLKYNSGRIIAVADSAQNTGNNIYYLESGRSQYVFSQSIRGGSKELKTYITSESDYVAFSDEYKRKSRNTRREIKVDMMKDGKQIKKTILVDQRQIVFYSKKYAIRAKRKREKALKKAYAIVGNPAAYTKATSHGALKYIKNIAFDKNTGEIKDTALSPSIDLEQIAEEEKYDGYYCIVTNIFDEDNSRTFSDDKIIDIYRGLWRIEDSFRVSKSELEARPVFLSRHERIHAHFLICFISLVILRLIQKKLNYEYTPENIVDTLRKISCSNETENLFLFDYSSDTSEAIGKAFGIDFGLKRRSRAEIKKIIGNSKKN